MRSQRIITFLILLLPAIMFAQSPKLGNIWYFGDKAGLDFTTGDPVAITNGALSSSEGVSVISDKHTGELKFYTNGGDFPFPGGVWNRNHQLMPNGDMSTSGGCNSSIQSAMILETPGGGNVHYIFTTDCQENSFAGGLSYTIVDMNMDGGLGDVVAKGVNLTEYTNEGLAAVRHANGHDYWLISHKVNSDSFYVYHFDKNGISGLVKSRVGRFTGQYAGEISVSANGERIAFHETFSTSLFNFDVSTGRISNHIDLQQPSSFGTFSPDCNLLYVTDMSTRQIYQFDVMENIRVAASKTLIANTAPSLPGAIKVGPNRRIYVTKSGSSTLDVIFQPNFRGTDCNYGKDSLSLGVRTATMGLPNLPSEALGECVHYPVENAPMEMLLNPKLVGPNSVTFHTSTTYSNARMQIIYRPTNLEGEWDRIETESNKFTIDGLEPGIQYDVKIAAYEQADGSIYEVISDHETMAVINENGNAEGVITRVTTLEEFELNVYPNPVQDMAKVDINFGDLDQNVDLAIYNAGGQIVYQTTLTNVNGFQTIDIPTEQMQNGMYNISLKSDVMRGDRRFVVVR